MCLPQTCTISTPFAECKNRECQCRPIGKRMTVAHDDGSEPKQKERRGAEPVWVSVSVRFTVMPHPRTHRANNTSVTSVFPMLSGQIIPTSSAATISERCLFSCRGYNEPVVRSILHWNPTGGRCKGVRKKRDNRAKCFRKAASWYIRLADHFRCRPAGGWGHRHAAQHARDFLAA